MMGGFGTNFGSNFAGEATFVKKVPTKRVAAELCVVTK